MATNYKTVSEIPDNYTLVTVDHEIDSVLESIGASDVRQDVGLLFVLEKDGDYESVYSSDRSVPVLTNSVNRLC